MDNNFSEYIFEMNKGLAVNKEIKLTLKECLEYATKDRLNKIAAIYEVVGRSKMKKGELVCALCDVITNSNNLQEAFITLEEEQDDLVQNLKGNDVIEITNTPINTYLPLYGKGVVFTYFKDNKIFMVMPTEVKEAIDKINSEDMNEHKNRFKLVEKYILAMANLYGIYEIDYLIETFNEQNEEKLDRAEFNITLEKLTEKNGLVSLQGNKLIHEALLEGEGLEELQQEVEGKEYFKPNKEELLKYSDEFYIEISPEHIKLKEFLNNLCNNEELAQGILEDICLALIDDSLNVESALFELERRDIVIDNVEMLKEYIGAIDGVNYKTRKWSKKGFNLIEKPEVIDSTPVVAEKKIGRNEPCPCESGKKYKKCCGK